MLQTIVAHLPQNAIPETAVLVEGSLQGTLPLNKSCIPLRQYVTINNRLALVFAVTYNEVKYRYVLLGGKLSNPYSKNVKVYAFMGTMKLPAELSLIP